MFKVSDVPRARVVFSAPQIPGYIAGTDQRPECSFNRYHGRLLGSFVAVGLHEFGYMNSQSVTCRFEFS